MSQPTIRPTTHNIFSNACVTRYALAELADTWTLLVVAALGERRYHFGELRRKIDGISQKMLTQTLRKLEKDGLITRTVIPGPVVTVQYALTPEGQSLLAPLHALQDWLIVHATHMEKGLGKPC
jgi:DNA-binding HxlR family transcriptional regulator